MQHKASAGEFCGGEPPYGFAVAADGVHIERIAAEQAVLAEVRALRAGRRSLRAIAAELTARGYLSRAGRPFVAEQINRMLARVA